MGPIWETQVQKHLTPYRAANDENALLGQGLRSGIVRDFDDDDALLGEILHGQTALAAGNQDDALFRQGVSKGLGRIVDPSLIEKCALPVKALSDQGDAQELANR